MQNERDKLLEAVLDMMQTDPNPLVLWGEDLAIALIERYESFDPALRKIPGMHRSQCMSCFELGRRYERKWPQHEKMEVTPVEKMLAGLEAPPTPEEMIYTLEAREAFAIQYGKDHGWDEDQAKWDVRQILEVREQLEWKEPKI